MALASIIFSFGTFSASRFVHEHMLERILYAPMAFFASTPSGLIINRFERVLQNLCIKLEYPKNTYIS